MRLPDTRVNRGPLRLRVSVGVWAEGTKELVTVSDGYRESTESWAEALRDLRGIGMAAPVLAVGDGALRLWNALGQVWPQTLQQLLAAQNGSGARRAAQAAAPVTEGAAARHQLRRVGMRSIVPGRCTSISRYSSGSPGDMDTRYRNMPPHGLALSWLRRRPPYAVGGPTSPTSGCRRRLTSTGASPDRATRPTTARNLAGPALRPPSVVATTRLRRLARRAAALPSATSPGRSGRRIDHFLGGRCPCRLHP